MKNLFQRCSVLGFMPFGAVAAMPANTSVIPSAFTGDLIPAIQHPLLLEGGK
jgi:hypothetical protein